MNRIKSFLIIIVILGFSPLKSQDMTVDELDEIITTLSDTSISKNGVWEFVLGETFLMCVTDVSNNRMRIITPIKKMNELTPEELQDAMEANFHSALDVRYALSDDLVWAAFIHPLRELSKDQVVDAISQVYSAALTFGESYTSTHLNFPKKKNKRERKRF